MKIASIDNGIGSELGNVILWQYDKAYRLISIIQMLRLFHDSATKSFWDSWIQNVFCQFEKDSDGNYRYPADNFGLSVWGIVLGVPRPDIDYGEEKQTLSIELYRRLLEGKFRILNTRMSANDIFEYLRTVYQGRYKVTDNLDMTISYEAVNDSDVVDEEERFIAQYPDIALVFPAAVRTRGSIDNGTVFAFEGQQSSDTSYPDTDTFDNANFIPA